MANFASLAAVMFGSSQATFGETVSYSRDAGPFDALAAFDVSAIINTSGEFESPTGPLYGEAMVKISDIDRGPQKGDWIVAAGKRFRVQELFTDPQTDMATLKIRYIEAA